MSLTCTPIFYQYAGKFCLPKNSEMFNLLTYFQLVEKKCCDTNNNKLSWLRTGQDSLTAISRTLSDSALTVEPIDTKES